MVSIFKYSILKIWMTERGPAFQICMANFYPQRLDGGRRNLVVSPCLIRVDMEPGQPYA